MENVKKGDSAHVNCISYYQRLVLNYMSHFAYFGM